MQRNKNLNQNILALRSHLEQVIVGQSDLLDRLLISVLTGGHVLLESLPGLAKTTAVTTLASGIHASFQRIQFTPDLLPGDLTGSEIYDAQNGSFRFVPGPIFNEIVLADEINRAPPKVQSALLEAMQERQVTVGGETRQLPELFIVMATQNPLEQSGTYPLPEAQLDRFLLHVVLDYPDADDELLILKRDRGIQQRQQHQQQKQSTDSELALHPEQVLQAREDVSRVHVSEVLEKYIVQLVGATRQLEKIDQDWKDYLQAGASPRASIALLRASSALAYLRGRDYVVPDDIIDIAPDVMRHRLVLGYAARAAEIDADAIIVRVLAGVPIP
jgi:MoxR-like ATPase